MKAVRTSDLSRSHTANPSMRGIITSRITMSTRSDCTFCRASTPSAAVNTCTGNRELFKTFADDGPNALVVVHQQNPRLLRRRRLRRP